MFDKEFYEILHNSNVEISNYTLEYLSKISNEEREKLNYILKCYGQKAEFESFGKDKILIESLKIRQIAENWVKEFRQNPNIKVPSLNTILEENLNYLQEKQKINEKQLVNNINNNKISVDTNYEVYEVIELCNLPETKKQKIAKIPVTDINNIENKTYQFDLFALEFPIFALKLNKKMEEFIFYTKNKDVKITLRSTSLGRATIQDSDVWLYCISKLMQLVYEEKTYNRRITFTAYDFLKKTYRSINGENYKQILNSLKRLTATFLEGEVDNKNLNVIVNGPLVESTLQIKNKNNRTTGIEVVLPEWLFDEIKNKKVAKINPKYFNLTPLQKRLYQLAKRHCSNYNSSYPINLNYLAQKIGIQTKISDFRYKLKKITENQPLPEYRIVYLEDTDQVQFVSRQNLTEQNLEKQQKIQAKNLR